MDLGLKTNPNQYHHTDPLNKIYMIMIKKSMFKQLLSAIPGLSKDSSPALKVVHNVFFHKLKVFRF